MRRWQWALIGALTAGTAALVVAALLKSPRPAQSAAWCGSRGRRNVRVIPPPRDSALPHQPHGRNGRNGRSLEWETSVTQASLPRIAPVRIRPTVHRWNPLSGSPERGSGCRPRNKRRRHPATRRILTRIVGATPTVREPAGFDKSALPEHHCSEPGCLAATRRRPDIPLARRCRGV